LCQLFHRNNGLVVSAHLLALEKAPLIGFGSYIVSATTPFTADHLKELNKDASAVVGQLFPSYNEIYARLGWKMFDRIDRVYVNELARKELGWSPKYDFSYMLSRLQDEKDIFSSMTHEIGIKGYHQSRFTEGPYPV
jgi:UDP-glucose 4-epimerase